MKVFFLESLFYLGSLFFFCLTKPLLAQQNTSPYFQQQQIIIQQNGNNQESFSIEMNGDQVFINGVPADQYKDSNVIIKSNHSKSSHPSKVFDTDDGFGMDWGDRNKLPLGLKLSDTSGVSGVEVLNVVPQSPADKAGIQKGDLLTNIDETEIKNIFDARKSVSKAYKKDSFQINLLRSQKKMAKKLYIPPKPQTEEL